MDLRSLRYFVAVVEAGSLTRAAGALYVAQPALTAQIKRLEVEFEVQLLERSHVGVTPTAAGLQLYQEATRLLADAAALRLRIAKPSGEPEGSVTVAFPGLLVPTLMGQVLLSIHRRFPRIRLYVIEGVSLLTQQAVQDGRADFGLLVDPPSIAGLTTHPLASESIYLSGLDPEGKVRKLLQVPSMREALSAAGSRRDRAAKAGAPVLRHDPATQQSHLMDRDPMIRFADAVTLPLVMQPPRFVIRRQAQEVANRLGVQMNIVHEHDSANVLRALRNAGAGFSLAPACATPARTDDPAQIRARLVDPEIVRSYALAWLTGRQLSRAARAVIAALREEVAQAIAQGVWAARHVDSASHQLE